MCSICACKEIQLKLVILEWICGGGMLQVPVAEIPPSLRQEGWGMVEGLARCLDWSRVAGKCELQLTVAVDERLGCPSLANVQSYPIRAHDAMEDGILPAAWLELAQSHDWALVIAPESDSILPRLVARLRGLGARLLNAHEPFLTNASDKLLTAERLHAAGIPHPPTIGLANLTDAWLTEHAAAAAHIAGEPCWVVKSRTGAGCEGLSRHRGRLRHAILAELHELYGSDDKPWDLVHFIVQPWLEGEAYSCSAMLDRAGRAQWLPLLTQEFSASFKYTGGCTVPAERLASPLELLNATLPALGDGAYGWIGIDLLYNAANKRWCVIEVNPRHTSSIETLSQSPQFALTLPV